MFSVYVLKSKSSEKFYIGQTENLHERLNWHNSPRARWTKRYQPWEIVYIEEYKSRGEAVKRERELKALKNIKLFIKL